MTTITHDPAFNDGCALLDQAQELFRVAADAPTTYTFERTLSCAFVEMIEHLRNGEHAKAADALMSLTRP